MQTPIVKNAIQSVVPIYVVAMATAKKTTASGRNAGLPDLWVCPFGSGLGVFLPFILLRLLR